MGTIGLNLITAISILVSGVGVSDQATAQCLECAQQMFQATLSSNIQYQSNQSMINDTRRRDAKNGICYDANRDYEVCEGKTIDSKPASISRSADGKVESAVLEILNTEYRRRILTQGKGKAGQWLNTAAGDIGRQMASLGLEYRRRSDADNSTVTDQWYIDTARQIATQYVKGHQGPGLGEAMINGVPATTRRLAENATFALIEPEIRRFEKSYRKADAMEWARSMGWAIGSGVKNLAPEYAKRVKVDGRTQADQWYVDQAKSLARLQVANSR